MHQPQPVHGSPCPPPKQLDANQVQVLQQLGFSTGLIQTVSKYANTVPLRIWLVDNSASMQVRDGHRISGSTFNNLQMTDCTRWEEAQDRVAFHAYMAGCLGFPTRFNMLDHNTIAPPLPSCFSIAEHGPAMVQSELQTAKQVMTQTQPIGRATPLAYHIMEIRKMVVQMAPQLVREGKLVSIVVLTSGLPTDNSGHPGPAAIHEFTQALQSLEGLPITVVVRLCTDDERVVDFYNTVDSKINLSFDVLDDHHGEAIEVYLKNPWLNYCLPLHQLRELGFPIKVFDEIDEQALTLRELYQLCALLFQTHQPFPDPATNWIHFLRALAQVLSRERMHFNPVTNTLGPWIDLRLLHYVYGRGMPFPQDIPVMEPQQHHYQQQSQSQQPQQGFVGSRNPQPHFGFQSPPQPHPHQTSPPQQQQQQQQQAAQPPAPAPDSSVSASKYEQQGAGDDTTVVIKRGILSWATAPPAHQQLKSIDQLLGTVPETFPPAFGLTNHDYFKKWKPFSLDALQGRDEAVLKRAMRKTKFFLHPDKLPKDLTKEQTFLCKMLWDIMADAWEAFGGNQ